MLWLVTTTIITRLQVWRNTLVEKSIADRMVDSHTNRREMTQTVAS